jgi:hypothetical protein
MSWQTTAKEIGKVVLEAAFTALINVIVIRFGDQKPVTKLARTKRKPRQLRSATVKKTA